MYIKLKWLLLTSGNVVNFLPNLPLFHIPNVELQERYENMAVIKGWNYMPKATVRVISNLSKLVKMYNWFGLSFGATHGATFYWECMLYTNYVNYLHVHLFKNQMRKKWLSLQNNTMYLILVIFTKYNAHPKQVHFIKLHVFAKDNNNLQGH